MDFLNAVVKETSGTLWGLISYYEQEEQRDQKKQRERASSKQQTSTETSEKLAGELEVLLGQMSPTDPLRIALCKVAKKYEPDASQLRSYDAQFKMADLQDHDFQFLLREAESLGINITVNHDVICVKTGLNKEYFHIGTDKRVQIVSCIKDAIKSQRSYLARKSKMSEALQQLVVISSNVAEEYENCWQEGGDKVVLYDDGTWKYFNTLCQIFTIMGGRVTHHLDGYQAFRLLYFEDGDHDNIAKISWTLPYSFRSLKKLRDIVSVLLVIDAMENSKKTDALAVSGLKERISSYNWEADFSVDALRVTAGIIERSYNGCKSTGREVRMLAMRYSLSNFLPLLELLWQVDSGEIITTFKPDDLSLHLTYHD